MEVPLHGIRRRLIVPRQHAALLVHRQREHGTIGSAVLHPRVMMVRGAKPLLGCANDVGPLLSRESLHSVCLHFFFKDLFDQKGTHRTKHANASLHGFRVCLVEATEDMFSQQNEFSAMLRYPFLLVLMKEGEFLAKLGGRVSPQDLHSRSARHSLSISPRSRFPAQAHKETLQSSSGY